MKELRGRSVDVRAALHQQGRPTGGTSQEH